MIVFDLNVDIKNRKFAAAAEPITTLQGNELEMGNCKKMRITIMHRLQIN